MSINRSDSQSRYCTPSHLYSAQAATVQKKLTRQQHPQDELVSLNQRDKQLREQMAKYDFKPPNERLKIAIQLAKYLFFTIALPLTLLTVTLPRLVARHLLPAIHQQFRKMVEKVFKPAETIALESYHQLLRFAQKTGQTLKKVARTAALPFTSLWNGLKKSFDIQTWLNGPKQLISLFQTIPHRLSKAIKSGQERMKKTLIDQSKQLVALLEQKVSSLFQSLQQQLNRQWQFFTRPVIKAFQTIKSNREKMNEAISIFQQKINGAIESIQTSVVTFMKRVLIEQPRAYRLQWQEQMACYYKKISFQKENVIRGFKKGLEALKQQIAQTFLFKKAVKLSHQMRQLLSLPLQFFETFKNKYKKFLEKTRKTHINFTNKTKEFLRQLAYLPSRYSSAFLKKILSERQHQQLSSLYEKVGLQLRQMGQSADEKRKQLFIKMKKPYLKVKKVVVSPFEFVFFKVKRALLWTKLIGMWLAILIGFWTLAVQRFSRSYVE